MSQRYFEDESHAAAYALLRPEPPASLISRIVEYLRQGYDGPLEAAVDVGCGSGQSTHILAQHFNAVTGADVSMAQIDEAIKHNKTPTVSFKVSSAESLPFPNNSLQLVTAGTACHWFDMPKFFKEVDRVLVPGGVVALYCYSLPDFVHPTVGEELNAVFHEVFFGVFGGYFGEGMKDAMEGYRDPKYTPQYPDSCRDKTHPEDKEMSVAELTLSITTWSGFNNYKKKNGDAAAQKILDDFQNKFMTILGVTTSPENTRLHISRPYWLILGRKPQV